MAEVETGLAAWRVGGQIDESILTAIGYTFADITVTATLIGNDTAVVVDPTNNAAVLRGPYTTVVGGTPGTDTSEPVADSETTLAGRLWWTEPLKATEGVGLFLEPAGLAWRIVVGAVNRRRKRVELATWTVGVDSDRDYQAQGETVVVPVLADALAPGEVFGSVVAVDVTNLTAPSAGTPTGLVPLIRWMHGTPTVATSADLSALVAALGSCVLTEDTGNVWCYLNSAEPGTVDGWVDLGPIVGATLPLPLYTIAGFTVTLPPGEAAVATFANYATFVAAVAPAAAGEQVQLAGWPTASDLTRVVADWTGADFEWGAA